MLVVKKFRAYLGLLLCLIAVVICPMLKVPIKGNWTLYQTDARLFFISAGIVVFCGLFLLLRWLSAFRFMVIVLFVWYILSVAAVYFKSNHYFNSKFADKLLAKTIHYQWGWLVLLVGVLFLMFSVSRDNKPVPGGLETGGKA